MLKIVFVSQLVKKIFKTDLRQVWYLTQETRNLLLAESISMILHLPHASTFIPEDLRNGFLLSNQKLLKKFNRISDHAADQTFQQAFPKAKIFVFTVSRLVVDQERFSDKSQEPMSRVGTGVTYINSFLRQLLLEQPTQVKCQELLDQYCIPHHQKLTEAVEESLPTNHYCLIIDGHSFPVLHLPHELQQTALRPDF